MTAPQILPDTHGDDVLLHVRHSVSGYMARCWKVPPGMTPGELLSVPVADRELLWAGTYDEDRHLTGSRDGRSD
jgi:hypothetical protein